MRRLLAITLLLVFGAFTTVPLFALGAGEDASLPACCRRGGMHHCAGMDAMMRAMAAKDGTNLSAVGMRCPAYPQATAPAHIGSYTTSAVARESFEAVQRRALHTQTLALYSIASDGARLKRGPPVETHSL